jgi:hypothetical protein
MDPAARHKRSTAKLANDLPAHGVVELDVVSGRSAGERHGCARGAGGENRRRAKRDESEKRCHELLGRASSRKSSSHSRALGRPILTCENTSHWSSPLGRAPLGSCRAALESRSPARPAQSLTDLRMPLIRKSPPQALLGIKESTFSCTKRNLVLYVFHWPDK